MFADQIKQNIILADYTTFKIGGQAKFFVSVAEPADLRQALIWAEQNGEPYFILGGGSNLLISDRGFDGLVIKINNQEVIRDGNKIIAGAGARLSDAVALSETESLTGLEWASGLPGSVGGAVRGNAGAFGHDLKDNLGAVEFFDTADQQFKTWPLDRLNYGYRHSLFKSDPSKIVWQAELLLQPGESAAISQAMNEILNKRLAGQPPYPSAGCVFKNLMAEATLIKTLAVADRVKGGKLACGLVIDSLGFKGKQVGGALVSPQHANFIVNYSDATAADVRALIAQIKQAAKTKFNLDLEEEIQSVGF